MQARKDCCDVRLELPMRLKSELNDRGSWRDRHRRRKAQRTQIWAALAACRRPRLPVDVFLTRVAPRLLDKGDNLNSAFKAIRDQIAHWLRIDDGGDQVIWHYDQRQGKPKQHGLIVEIYGSDE